MPVTAILRLFVAAAVVGFVSCIALANAAERQLEAVFIGPDSASALIGGELYREGDRLDDARITEIRRGEVIMLADDGAYSLSVGAPTSLRVPALAPDSAGSRRAANPEVRTSSDQPSEPHQPDEIAAIETAFDESTLSSSEPPVWAAEIRAEGVAAGQLDRPASADGVTTYRTRWGDTLSQIAASLERPGVSLHTAMTAIYAANRHAFSTDMDDLITGAVLSIPTGMTLASSALTDQIELVPERASAKSGQATTLVVEPGDTLSDIAESVKPPGITTWQMMHRLYAANPEAFGQSIDVLFAGASLLVPGVQDNVPVA